MGNLFRSHSYESVVQNASNTIVYDCTINSSKYESHLRGTTVWWWLSYIGSMQQLITGALSLIGQKDPSSKIFREIQPVNPRKYRSNKRKNLLQRCIEFLNVEEEFRRLFSNSVFPHFTKQAVWCCYIITSIGIRKILFILKENYYGKR